ncbi:MAG: molybdenum cofactor biosynthesis protein MoaE [Anaerolineae bacterium]
MELEIRLFATLKDRTGKPRIRITLPEPATVQQLLVAIAAAYPALAESLPTTLVSVNQAFASPETAVTPQDEIALFPPVSGGSGDEFPHPTYFALSEEPFDLNEIHGRLTQPDIGAIVTFSGSVRGQTERDGLPPQTIRLEYEAYGGMAEAKMAQIAREIWERWPQVKGIAIVQRIGKLDVGDATTLVACASGHRDQGVFAAARYGIDRLKKIVPVWKKEVGPDKSVWVEGHYRPTEADN